MTDTSAQRSLLRRTKAHGESEMDELAPEMALSKAILRSCDKDMHMHASAGQCKSALLSLPELLDGLPEKGLIATLDGADGALGLVCLDSEGALTHRHRNPPARGQARSPVCHNRRPGLADDEWLVHGTQSIGQQLEPAPAAIAPGALVTHAAVVGMLPGARQHAKVCGPPDILID